MGSKLLQSQKRLQKEGKQLKIKIPVYEPKKSMIQSFYKNLILDNINVIQSWVQMQRWL